MLPSTPSPEASEPVSHTPGALQAAQEAQAAFLNNQPTVPEAVAPTDAQQPIAVPVTTDNPAGTGFLGDLAGAQKEPVLPTNTATGQQFTQAPDAPYEAAPLVPPTPPVVESAAVSPATEATPPTPTPLEVAPPTALVPEATTPSTILEDGDKLVIPPQVGEEKVEAVKREAGETIASPTDLRVLGEKLAQLPEQLSPREASELIVDLVLAQRHLENQVLSATDTHPQAA